MYLELTNASTTVSTGRLLYSQRCVLASYLYQVYSSVDQHKYAAVGPASATNRNVSLFLTFNFGDGSAFPRSALEFSGSES